MSKKKTIKPGYYSEKSEGFIYLYIPGCEILKGHFIFLPTDSGDDDAMGRIEYDNEELHSRCKYLGTDLSDLIKHLTKP